MLLIISLSLFLTLLSSVQSADLLSQPEVETGSPGGSLRLTCKASGFSVDGYSMYWIQQIPGQGLELLLHYYSSSKNNYAPAIKDRFTAFKDISNNTFGLDIKLLKIEDTAMYYCGVYYSNWAVEWGQGTMVTVTAAMPSAPTLYGLVSSCQQGDTDRSITYGCLAMDYIPDVTRVTWKKDGEKLTAGLKTYPSVRGKKGTYTLSSQLTLTESEMNCSKIYCEVQHSKSNKSIAMPCPSEDAPPTLLLTVSSREDISSSKYATVLCSIIGFHPKSISVSWLKNGFPMDSSFFTSPVCEAYGKFSATSWLNISAVEWFHSAVYTCQVTHQGLTQSRSINAPQKAPNHSALEYESGICDCLDYTVKILPPPVEQVLLDATVTLTCVVSKLGSGVLVTWTRGEETVKSEIADKPGDAADSVTSTLVISTQAWLSGDHFDCSVNHQHLPTPARDSIRKEKVTNLLEPSVSVLLPTSEEISEQTVVSLTCLVRGFFPREVFIKWTTNNKPVNPSNYRNTKVMAENDNTSFFMYSLLSITVEEWASGASYSCVVGHEAIPLKTINRTVDKFSGKPSFVNISLALMDTINSCQ